MHMNRGINDTAHEQNICYEEHEDEKIFYLLC